VNNSQLADSSITVSAGTGLTGGGTVALGGSTTLKNAGVLSVTGNADITASTVGGAVTLGDTATSVNTASTIVKRDGTGSFSAQNLTLTGALTLPATGTSPDIIQSGTSLLLYCDTHGNFFNGQSAGNSTTAGSDNTATGQFALNDDTTGSYNTANGFQALNANTAGSYNTAIGYNALISNTSGSNNATTGRGALFNNTTGSNNMGDGVEVLNNNTSGSYNIALGYQAGYDIATGNSNIDIGNPGLSTDANIIRIGSNQTTTYIAGVINGDGGGLTNLNASILTSVGNTGVGAAFNFFVGPSGNSTTTGNQNTAIGSQALIANGDGTDYTATGSQALEINSSGSGNTATGQGALRQNFGGFGNTATGNGALFNNIYGSNNTADGFQALLDLTSGSAGSGTSDIAVGYQAAINYTGNESSNIVIGNAGQAGENNTIRIGTQGVQTSTFLVGNISIGESNPAAALHITSSATTPPAALNSSDNGLLLGTTGTSGYKWIQSYGGSLILNPIANNVGIGITNPAYPLEMGSGAYCSAAGVWTSVSDRNAKEDFAPIKPAEVLAKVAALPITQWKYKVERNGIKHLGPVAQDFYSVFGLGDNDRAIGTIDESGVALAAIQGLNQKLEAETKAKDAEIEKLKERADKVDSLEKQLEKLKQMVQLLAERK